VTIIVTPVRVSDSLYGEELTVHIDDLVAPEDGDCGFNEGSAAAVSTIGDSPWFLRYDGATKTVYVDDAGEHYGSLRKRAGAGYPETMVVAGYGRPIASNDHELLDTAASEAQSSNARLWATCPDFGA
jgi:hypothetical protein